MLLPSSGISTETSATIKDMFFGIDDPSLVFDILRTKIYADPILAICREISCNARDAHREVGTPDLPIEIAIPTYLDSTLRIKDFGPGISESRMSEIFTKYGASTKRNDNVQTGGYGLGCKTPFSYTDIFNITTVVDGKKFHYQAYIDESRLGKVVQMSCVDTDDPNGTTISIPIKSKDFYSVISALKKVFEHWNPRPIFNELLDFDNQKKILSGSNWFVTHNQNSYGRKTVVILDGIAYEVDQYALPSAKCDVDLWLIANTGDVHVSASRDALHYSQQTIDFINDNVASAKQEINNLVKTELNKITNYRDFLNYLHNFSPVLPEQVTWDGSSHYRDFVIFNNLWLRSHERLSERSKKIQRLSIQTLISSNTYFVHAKSVHQLSRYAKHLAISGKSGIRLVGVIGVIDDKETSKRISDLKTHDIDLELPKEKRVYAKRTGIQVYNVSATSSRFQFDSLDEIPEDGGVYVVVDARCGKTVTNSDKTISASEFNAMKRLAGVDTVYGISKAKASKLSSDWIPLFDLVLETVESNDDMLREVAKIKRNYSISCVHEERLLSLFVGHSGIDDPIFEKGTALFDEFFSSRDKYRGSLTESGITDHIDNDKVKPYLDAREEKIEEVSQYLATIGKKYELLPILIGSYSYHSNLLKIIKYCNDVYRLEQDLEQEGK